MGKNNIKIKKIPKKAILIPKGLKNTSKNEPSHLTKIKIDEQLLKPKIKNKKKLILNDNKKEKNNCKFKKIKKKIKKTSNKLSDDFIDDKAVCAHLLLNSYAHTNTLDFLPEKTTEQRIKTMRDKIISLFPDLKNME